MLRKAIQKWLGLVEDVPQDEEDLEVMVRVAQVKDPDPNPYLDEHEAWLVRDYMLTASVTLGPTPWVCDDFVHIRHSFVEAVIIPVKLFLRDQEGSLNGLAWEISKLYHQEMKRYAPTVESFVGQGYDSDWIFESTGDAHDVRAESMSFIDAALEGNHMGALRVVVGLGSRIQKQESEELEVIPTIVDFLSQMLMAFAIKLFELENFPPEEDEAEEG